MSQLAPFACWLMTGGNPPRAAAVIGSRPLPTSVTIKSRVTSHHKLVFLCTETHPISPVLTSVGTTAGSAETKRQLAPFASWLFVGGNPPRAEALIGNRPLLPRVSKKSRATIHPKKLTLAK
ncbi:hypothetical protein [Sporosarcina sp. GW1-11]|uniref:hypothetical protein n=1 Tax=Sporosarcina sp. GW1-11 TaxID=2899126 RepID=UPI002952DB67|nr:hypothetical protein [Sporosarcina sp. GW1-11]